MSALGFSTGNRSGGGVGCIIIGYWLGVASRVSAISAAHLGNINVSLLAFGAAARRPPGGINGRRNLAWRHLAAS